MNKQAALVNNPNIIEMRKKRGKNNLAQQQQQYVIFGYLFFIFKDNLALPQCRALTDKVELQYKLVSLQVIALGHC